MPISKPMNKKNFYGANEVGGTPDIAMPNYDETPAIAKSAPDPWQQQAQQQQTPNPFGSVPDEIPAEVQQEMNLQNQQQPDERDEEDYEEETPPSPRKEDHPNFRTLRADKDRAERERDAILSQMLEMQQRMQAMQQQQAPQQQEQPQDLDFDIEADALAEGKHIKKLVANQKAMEQQLRRYQAMSEEQAIEVRLKSQYPDIDKVVSTENVEKLARQYPEIAETLRNTSDLYNKAASAYTLIKNFGIHKDPVAPYENDRARAIVNSQKPRPLASVSPQQGDSPLSKANAFANGMTDDLKEQLRREMYAARKAH